MLGLGDPDALGVDTAARAQLARLNASIDGLVEASATAAWVDAVAGAELDGYEQALEMRALIHSQARRLLEGASATVAPAELPATNWHDSLQALLTAALADLQARSRDAVRLSSYTPDQWMSVWSVSHRLYGTALYAEEILRMNPHVEHPLLVPPGRALRVVRH